MNQDRVYADPTLLALFDGVGGRAVGEVAAMLALAETVKTAALDRVTAEPRVLRCLQMADRSVTQTADQLGVSIGTTAVIVLLSVAGDAPSCQVGWAGDSIALLVRGRGVVELTEEVRDPGDTSYGDALTRWLGNGDHLPPLAVEHALEPGDILILASDGITEVLSVGEIGRIASNAATAQLAASSLTEAARDRAVNDNASVVVARLLSGAPDGQPPPKASIHADAPMSATADFSTLTRTEW